MAGGDMGTDSEIDCAFDSLCEDPLTLTSGSIAR